MSQPAPYPFESQPLQPVQADASIQTAEEKAEESRRIRRLQLMMTMVMQVIQQDRNLPVEQASAMFPDKELAFDLLYWPRLQRMMRERYRMQ